MTDFKINPKDPLTIIIGLVVAAIAGFFVLKNNGNNTQVSSSNSGCGCGA